MPRPRRVSDEQIRTAARKVFQQVGINAPVALVAKALGVTPAALFHRTGSKEQLFVMAMTNVEPRQFKIIQALREGPSTETPVESQLIEILTRLSAHLAVVSPNIFLMFAAGKRPKKRRGLYESTRRELTNWLERARPMAPWHFHNAAMIAEALAGSIEARHVYGFLHGRHTSVAREHRFVRALVGELLSGGQARRTRTNSVEYGTAAGPAPPEAVAGADPTDSQAPPTIDAAHS
jgi:AcrR family transcriptional regulator